MKERHRPRKTHELFVLELKNLVSTIDIKSKYTGAKNKVDLLCSICGHLWTSTPDTILRTPRCPKCLHKIHNKYTRSEILEILDNNNSNIELLEDPISTKNKVLCLCIKCKHVWSAKVANLIYLKSRCPMCTSNYSKGEVYIKEILDDLKISYKLQFKINCNTNFRDFIYVDFYIPTYNLIIEFNGIQHYVPVDAFGGKVEFEKQILRDKWLSNYCTKNNVNLLIIKYDEKDLLSIITTFILLHC